MAILSAGFFVANMESPIMGLAERISILIGFQWTFVLAMWIFSAKGYVVEKSLRNLGYGTRLMHRVEVEASQLGCQNAHVDTYSFEAKPFYERLGYELFATLKDYPEGQSKYFLKKRLVG
jgi:GNAT superfamily N-acetyltransferase